MFRLIRTTHLKTITRPFIPIRPLSTTSGNQDNHDNHGQKGDKYNSYKKLVLAAPVAAFAIDKKSSNEDETTCKTEKEKFDINEKENAQNEQNEQTELIENLPKLMEVNFKDGHKHDKCGFIAFHKQDDISRRGIWWIQVAAKIFEAFLSYSYPNE